MFEHDIFPNKRKNWWLWFHRALGNTLDCTSYSAARQMLQINEVWTLGHLVTAFWISVTHLVTAFWISVTHLVCLMASNSVTVNNQTYSLVPRLVMETWTWAGNEANRSGEDIETQQSQTTSPNIKLKQHCLGLARVESWLALNIIKLIK